MNSLKKWSLLPMTLLTVMVSCKGSVDEGDSYDEVYEPIDLSDRIRGVNLTKNKL